VMVAAEGVKSSKVAAIDASEAIFATKWV
jgi:hypothetical protein